MKYLSTGLKLALENLEANEEEQKALAQEVPAEEHTPELVAESNAHVEAVEDAAQDVLESHSNVSEAQEIVEELEAIIAKIEESGAVVSTESAEGDTPAAVVESTVTDGTAEAGISAAGVATVDNPDGTPLAADVVADTPATIEPQVIEGADAVVPDNAEAGAEASQAAIGAISVNEADVNAVLSSDVAQTEVEKAVETAVSVEQLRQSYRDLTNFYAKLGIPTASFEALETAADPESKKAGVLAGAKARAGAIVKVALEHLKKLIERFKAFITRLLDAGESLKKRAGALKSKAAATKGELPADAKHVAISLHRIGFEGKDEPEDVIIGLSATHSVYTKLASLSPEANGIHPIIGNQSLTITPNGASLTKSSDGSKGITKKPFTKAQVEKACTLVIEIVDATKEAKAAMEKMVAEMDEMIKDDKEASAAFKSHATASIATFSKVAGSIFGSLRSVLSIGEQSLKQYKEAPASAAAAATA